MLCRNYLLIGYINLNITSTNSLATYSLLDYIIRLRKVLVLFWFGLLKIVSFDRRFIANYIKF